jgi:hypothetical protein
MIAQAVTHPKRQKNCCIKRKIKPTHSINPIAGNGDLAAKCTINSSLRAKKTTISMMVSPPAIGHEARMGKLT